MGLVVSRMHSATACRSTFSLVVNRFSSAASMMFRISTSFTPILVAPILSL